MGKKIPSYQKNAIFAGTLILILLVVSLTALFWHSRANAGSRSLSALIYQDGQLLHDIDLSNVTESYQITVTDDNRNYNIIEIRPGSIGIIEASCPDKLCVHMGFQESSLLPLICLPNRLVIRITISDDTTASDPPIDGVTY